jgi:hypothetical protein
MGANLRTQIKGQGVAPPNIRYKDEPTWRCHHNPLVGALRIQEPVILGEPQIIS